MNTILVVNVYFKYVNQNLKQIKEDIYIFNQINIEYFQII